MTEYNAPAHYMAGQPLEWQFGLISAAGRYLTQETFGFALNANGPSLKKKQTFTLQADGEGFVYLKTHLGRYVYGTESGEVRGDAEFSESDDQIKWLIEPQASGQWAIKNMYGFYLRGTGENLWAFQDALYDDSLWTVHLAMHPQINLKNVMRKRYVHYADGELQCNEDVPWGEDALLTFVFFPEDGRYGFIAANGQYLSKNGSLVEVQGTMGGADTNVPSDCKFQIGFHDDQISLRDDTGRYLSAVGNKATLRTNKQTISKDELFVMEDSEPQFSIYSMAKGKFVSSAQGEELSANQSEPTDTELYQLEIHPATGTWCFKTSKERYWSVLDTATVQASDVRPDGPDNFFEVEWRGDETKIKGANGSYLGCVPNGQLVAKFEPEAKETGFIFTLINRPQFVLRGPYGFVATKGATMKQECNKSTPDIYELRTENGGYSIMAENGLYWAVDGDGGITANSPEPETFFLEFVQHSRLMIKCSNGRYLQGEQNGGFKAVGTSANQYTLWEY